MQKPLAGVRVLDLTRVLAGPYCTMMLSDLGAEIVKIEVPLTGDDSRSFGPFKNGKSLYFLNVNRGKESVAINLKTGAGKKLLRDLAKKCDVLVENFRPGTMEKLGLGWDVLQKDNPALIYAAVSGFGHTGPDSLRPAYDILVQAMGGVMSITGWPDSPPTRVGLSMGDITAAIFTSTGIVSALYQREKTGKGQKVDVSMLDCQLAILENALVRYQVEGKPPAPLGTRHPTITPFQAFQASDGWFVVAVGNDALWNTFCAAIKRPDLAVDPRYSSNGDRTMNISGLEAELGKMFAVKQLKEWLALLETAGVPCAPVNTIDKVLEDRQLKARNMFVTVDDPVAGKIIIPGNPIKMESIPECPDRPPAPEIGEHTDKLLRSLLGLEDEEIERLKSEGVL
ncbi:MAG: CoA transferase [Chrysiogenales bacterium]|nr:CoA transferase [Candidatus Aminicenantes bacterium]TFG81031.1 MAG: CoA transferase [Chrysiogenales bacterium]